MLAEFTFVAIRQRAIHGGLIARTVAKFEEHNLRLVGMKLMALETGYLGICEHDTDITERHPTGPLIAVLLRGENAIHRVRELLKQIESTTENLSRLIAGQEEGSFLRSDLFHASDCVASAKQEIVHWFSALELGELAPTIGGWLSSNDTTKWTRRCEDGEYTDLSGRDSDDAE